VAANLQRCGDIRIALKRVGGSRLAVRLLADHLIDRAPLRKAEDTEKESRKRISLVENSVLMFEGTIWF
jgi:hypothetical protein